MTAARIAAAEGVGTFFLVLFGPGAVMVDAWSGGRLGPLGIAFAFGAVVAVVGYALGPVSGAHINPAVTLTLWHTRQVPGRRAALHVTAQCLGATAAALALRAGLGEVGDVGATVPMVAGAAAFGIEFLLSFVLMLVVAESVHRPGPAAPFAVGATVGLCALVGGPLTGASMNPARSLGPALASGVWTQHWLYWLAPLAGMGAAAHVHCLLRPAPPPA